MDKIIFLICLWSVFTVATLGLRKLIGQSITKRDFILYCIVTIASLIYVYFRLD